MTETGFDCSAEFHQFSGRDATSNSVATVRKVAFGSRENHKVMTMANLYHD